VKFYDSKVTQKTGQGGAIITDEADGPNLKGKVRAQIQAQMDSAKHDISDPLTAQRLLRSQRDFAEEYFNSMREGELGRGGELSWLCLVSPSLQPA
jgi:hypothetical protein